jgi:hypothetical protein
MDLGPPGLFRTDSPPPVHRPGPPADLFVCDRVGVAGTETIAVVTRQAATHHHSASSFIGTIDSLLSSAGTFFSQLASLRWPSLLLGLALYAVYLLLRSRALFHAVRAAYPNGGVRWRDVWGGYMVGYAVNNVFPLGGGNVAQLFLTRMSIREGSYPTIATALSTGVIFDWFIGVLVMGFAFTQGVFPKPPDFSKLPAFDISFFASNPRFTLFFLTVLAIAFLVGFALL